MFVFSLIFFDAGINNFFKTPVNEAISNSLAISNVYVDDLKKGVANYSKALAIGLSQKEQKEMIQTLKDEQDFQKIDFVLFEFVNSQINVIYQSPFSSDLHILLIANTTNQFSHHSDISYEVEGYILSVQSVDDNLFLAVMSQIDEKILTHRNSINVANEQYMKLYSERLKIKWKFISIFVFISAIVILLAIFIGLIYSRKTLAPINKVMNAINNVSSGNYNTFISFKIQHNEWDDLVATFNNMIKAINDNRKQISILSKQSAWKDMARKMAHEIKNPLTPILLSAERLRRKYDKETAVQPEVFNGCINTIVRQVNNINNLVKEFSEFARLPDPKPELNDLLKLLNDIVLMYTNSYPNIVFRYQFSNDELVFKFDVTQINQVLDNVIINAIHSITENVVNEQVILITCRLNDDNVFITIEDSGTGLSDIVLEKAIEPYYTTRKNGTGLGLAIVYKIMNDHHGQVILGNSQILGGAKVTLRLPYCN